MVNGTFGRRTPKDTRSLLAERRKKERKSEAGRKKFLGGLTRVARKASPIRGIRPMGFSVNEPLIDPEIKPKAKRVKLF